MDRFRLERKGYDKKEVEDYLARSEKQRQTVISEQAMRIEEMKAQIVKLEQDNESYRLRENSVNEALLSAIEKAKEIDGTTRIRFALEGERIKLFENKWISYCKKTMQSLKIKNETVEFLNSVDSELAQLMYQDLNIMQSEPAEQYAAEKARLKKRGKIAAEHKDHIGDEENIFTYDDYEAMTETPELQATQKSKITQAKVNSVPQQSTAANNAFNLDDLQNPPTLADLCKQLGL